MKSGQTIVAQWLVLIAILCTAGANYAGELTPVVDGAKSIAGLSAQELLALIALICLGLVFYMVRSYGMAIRDLASQLNQRPCIRDPEND